MSSGLLDSPWLWPFLACALALVAGFSASLFRAAQADAPDLAPAAPTLGPHPRTALALGVAVPLAILALYAALGAPRALDPAARSLGDDPEALASQVEDRVAALAERLETQPEDLNGWLMLARSYQVLGQRVEAARAYARADALDRRAVRGDADRLTDWIEARILADQQHFDRESQALLAEAVALAPNHPGVLMMRGLAALDRGDHEAARRAFIALREQHAPDSLDRATLDRALERLARGEDPRARAEAASHSPTPSPAPTRTPPRLGPPTTPLPAR